MKCQVFGGFCCLSVCHRSGLRALVTALFDLRLPMNFFVRSLAHIDSMGAIVVSPIGCISVNVHVRVVRCSVLPMTNCQC